MQAFANSEDSNYSNDDPGVKLGPQNVVEIFRKMFRNLRLKNNNDAICDINIKDGVIVMVICINNLSNVPKLIKESF